MGVGTGGKAGGVRPVLVINFDPALARALASKEVAHSVFAAVKTSVAKASAEKGAIANATSTTSVHALSRGDVRAIWDLCCRMSMDGALQHPCRTQM